MRLEVDLDKIYHNAFTLVSRLRQRGIAVTGVTKATLGSPEIARTWLRAGVCGLGDSRIENIDRMRAAQTPAAMTLIRTPMLSQVDRVVSLTSLSLNTEVAVIRELSAAAHRMGCIHGVVLMVELGDLREGIMPAHLHRVVRQVLAFSNVSFLGIGTNLACRSGVVPDEEKMTELSAIADSIDASFGPIVQIVTGGNSANLDWALSDSEVGRVNNLRLGEALLLGCEPLQRKTISGLHTSAITLIAEVIEVKNKPSKPWGRQAQNAFGDMIEVVERGDIRQAILAIGRQDVDPDGLTPPRGLTILSASSDHLVVEVSDEWGMMKVGTEISFELDYSALLRAMTSPFVTKVMSKPTYCEGPLATAPL